jgi:hypothetical protein
VGYSFSTRSFGRLLLTVLGTIRRIAREAVIFTLLGPFLLLAVTFVYLTCTSPTRADYVKVPPCPETLPKDKTCLISGKDGAFLVEGAADGPWSSAGGFLGGYATDISAKHRYVWLPDKTNVGEFDLDARDAGIQVAISQDFPHAYKFRESIVGRNLVTSSLAAVLFGWPLGLGVWFTYRIVRFAIQG